MDQAGIMELAGQGFRLEQTHISWVLIGEKEVWKIKKPVDFGFLDYGDMEKRRLACEAEVELNRRFSPEVYLGVVPVTLDGMGRRSLGGKGRVEEWAVHMVRLPDADRADQRLASGRLPTSFLRNLATRLTGFHASARQDDLTDALGSADAVARNVRENLRQAGPCLAGLLGPKDRMELEDWLRGFPAANAALFQMRMSGGRVRDGHGDLRLSQIYFDDRGNPSLLDCIEFNDRFRFGDVCSDISFLAMDLASHGRPDLSEAFLAVYAEASGDFDLYALADFYMGYRATVRGKIACLLSEDGGIPETSRLASRREAEAHFRLALSIFRRQPRTGPVILVGGGVATGKSTLAAALGETLGAPVLRSDVIRKRMAGIDPFERKRETAWEGLYSEANTAKVYAQMVRWTDLILASGRPVIVDATFRSRSHREAMRSCAERAGSPFLFLECRADPDIVRERLSRRALEPGVSDGDEYVSDAIGAAWEPASELQSSEHRIVDTHRTPEEILEDVLGGIPKGLQDGGVGVS